MGFHTEETKRGGNSNTARVPKKILKAQLEAISKIVIVEDSVRQMMFVITWENITAWQESAWDCPG